MSRVEELQRHAISIAVVALCAGALYLIISILNGNEFNETGAQGVATGVAFALFLLLGLTGQSLSVSRKELAWIGQVTILVAGTGFVVMFLAIWSDWAGGGDSFVEPAFVLLAVAWALGHTSVLLRGARPEDGDGVRLLRGATICIAIALAALVSIQITSDFDDGWEAPGVLTVLYVLGTVLLPLVRRLDTAKPVPQTSPPPPRVPTPIRHATAPTDVSIRAAYASDGEEIAAIYNQGIEERQATFQTRPHGPGELELKTEQRGGQLIVAESDGRVVGWAGWSGYDDPADYYAGIAECAVYVGRDARRKGVGVALLEGLAAEAAKVGIHKLVAKIFTTNQGSVELFRRSGFREVGTHLRHGELDGEWKDVLVMERALPPA